MLQSQMKLAEGKTKIIRATEEFNAVDLEFKDDTTAGNGKRHEIIRNKGTLAAITSSCVFVRLANHGIDTAFIRRVGPNVVRMRRGNMLPLEVVRRFEASGSYCKRNPEIAPGTELDELVAEFYLKTSGKNFHGIALPDDDPIITHWDEEGISVRDAALEEGFEETFIPAEVIYGPGQDPFPFEEMEDILDHTGWALLHAWEEQGCRLVDFKIEFDDKLRVSDELGADSWRLLSPDGRHLDKQPFREGASVEATFAIYREVACRAQRLITRQKL